MGEPGCQLEQAVAQALAAVRHLGQLARQALQPGHHLTLHRRQLPLHTAPTQASFRRPSSATVSLRNTSLLESRNKTHGGSPLPVQIGPLLVVLP